MQVDHGERNLQWAAAPFAGESTKSAQGIAAWRYFSARPDAHADLCVWHCALLI
jgi:hypothetical protein